MALTRSWPGLVNFECRPDVANMKTAAAELSRLRGRRVELVGESRVILARLKQGGPRTDAHRYRTVVAEIGEVDLELAALGAS